MPEPLIVSIPHRLGQQEAQRRLRSGIARAAASLPILTVDEERWEGNRLSFRVRAMGQAATGKVDVEENHVRIEVILPWLLQRFAQTVQQMIGERGKLLLTKKD